MWTSSVAFRFRVLVPLVFDLVGTCESVLLAIFFRYAFALRLMSLSEQRAIRMARTTLSGALANASLISFNFKTIHNRT